MHRLSHSRYATTLIFAACQHMTLTNFLRNSSLTLPDRGLSEGVHTRHISCSLAGGETFIPVLTALLLSPPRPQAQAWWPRDGNAPPLIGGQTGGPQPDRGPCPRYPRCASCHRLAASRHHVGSEPTPTAPGPALGRRWRGVLPRPAGGTSRATAAGPPARSPVPTR